MTRSGRKDRAANLGGSVSSGCADQARLPDLADTARLLYTPQEAAHLLAVPESWLRRKAGRRLIPCTFVGKHLRFTPRDLSEITDAGSQQVVRPRHPRRHR